jgi:hypothetical protein
MRRKTNLIGVCLLAMFVVIFGSILSMGLFTAGGQPAAVSVQAVTEPPQE